MSKRKLDLTNVETFTKMSEGIHRVKVVSCEDKTTQAGDDMIAIAFEAVNGDDKGSRVYDNFVLTDKALWKLKQLLKALGVKCDGKIVLDTDKLIGKQCDAEIFHEEYNGQLRARVNEYTKVSVSTSDDDDDVDDDEGEEEKPVKKPEPKSKKPTKKEPEPEDDDEDDWDEEDEEEPAPKKKSETKKPEKKAPKKKPEPEEDDDDDEDWEEA